MSTYTREFPYANLSHLYVYELAEAVRRHRVYDTDFALFSDDQFYAKVWRDAEISRCVNYRAQMVSGDQKEWKLIPANEKSKEDRAAAQIMTALLRKTQRFTEMRRNLALAFLKGSSWSYLYDSFAHVSIPGYGRHRWKVFHAAKDVDKRRFDLMRIEQGARGKARYEWHIAQGMGSGGVEWKKIDRARFVRHVYHEDEASLGYGRGLSHALYFLAWWKQEVMRNGLQFLNRWSQGLVIYSVDCLLQASKGTSADDRAEEALDMLDRIRAGNNIVIPTQGKGVGDSVQVVDPPQGGWDTAKDAASYIDEMISRLVLGSVTNTGGGTEKGSLARAEVEDSAMGRLIGFDRELLAETIDRDFVEPLWRANRVLIRSLGLGKAERPRFEISANEDQSPQEDMATLKGALDAAPQLAQLIKAQEVLERTGYGAAGDDDMTLAQLADESKNNMSSQSYAASQPAEIVKMVSQGEIPPDSAVVLLALQPGITVGTAKALVKPAATLAEELRKRQEEQQEKEQKQNADSEIGERIRQASKKYTAGFSVLEDGSIEPYQRGPENVVNVSPPVVTVNNPPQNYSINLPPSKVEVRDAPAPDVHVHVEPTPVNVHNQIDVEPAPVENVVNVEPTPVNVEAPSVNVAAPPPADVRVDFAPNVNVEAPNVTIPDGAIEVDVNIAAGKRRVKLQRDDYSGKLLGAEVEEVKEGEG